ncbi:DUF4190 domain-containing protein [Nocardioides sp. KC13]|uniref:DUF4190 domain-containing protein n=1 Tax=Nocardioides turkmenicus TaxID=2711220 RepID=A0A6M1QZB6_9ACTN|nr:DUF4190 domain-containing protein [Nocardioides sp. KC13]NGN92742.1 DUF4190 domain-containing protein [Nocardioides sp. KC13]
MTNPSDDQPDLNKPADASPTPPPNPSEPTPESDQSDVTRVATPPGSTPPAPTQPMYGQTYGEQPSNPYGGATFDQNPPVPPAPTAGYGQTPPPPTYGGQPGYGQAPYGAPAAYSAQVGTPDSGATTAMVLGIIGLAGGFFCGLPIVLSPFALFMGLSAKKRIDAAAGALTGRGNAQAGFILGIIGTVLLVLSIVVITIVIIIGVSGGFDDSSYDSGYDSYDSEF